MSTEVPVLVVFQPATTSPLSSPPLPPPTNEKEAIITPSQQKPDTLEIGGEDAETFDKDENKVAKLQVEELLMKVKQAEEELREFLLRYKGPAFSPPLCFELDKYLNPNSNVNVVAEEKSKSKSSSKSSSSSSSKRHHKSNKHHKTKHGSKEEILDTVPQPQDEASSLLTTTKENVSEPTGSPTTENNVQEVLEQSTTPLSPQQPQSNGWTTSNSPSWAKRRPMSCTAAPVRQRSLLLMSRDAELVIFLLFCKIVNF